MAATYLKCRLFKKDGTDMKQGFALYDKPNLFLKSWNKGAALGYEWRLSRHAIEEPAKNLLKEQNGYFPGERDIAEDKEAKSISVD